jgi:transcriptional regulator with XRE-family HTH domain
MAVLSQQAPATTVTITTEKRHFFVELGGRIAKLRKAVDTTQVELAEILDVAQQTMQAYESGARRIPVSTLPLLAGTLGVSLKVLFGEETKASRGKRDPAPQWQEQMEAIGHLPRARQRFVLDMLNVALAQQSGC